MEMISVRSSNLSRVGYDPAATTLMVEFKSGSVYEYFGVPDAVFQGLLKAPSQGTYFDANVRKGPYRFRQVK